MSDRTHEVRVASARARAVAQICADPERRRELLYLRAKEKGDEQSLEYLDEIDPGVGERVRWLEDEVRALGLGMHTSTERRLVYGWMFDRLFDHYAGL